MLNGANGNDEMEFVNDFRMRCFGRITCSYFSMMFCEEVFMVSCGIAGLAHRKPLITVTMPFKVSQSLRKHERLGEFRGPILSLNGK